MQIRKRDGRIEKFNNLKIKEAIKKAYISTGQKYDNEILNKIASQVEEKCYKKINVDLKNNTTDKSILKFDTPKIPTVEEIQNLVEIILMDINPIVAKSYIRYRYKREVAREYTNEFFDEIGKKLSGKYVQNQNANVDEASFGGRIGEATSHMMKTYALNFLMSPMSKKNHEENMIYIHDLDHYAIGDHNCFERKTKFITSQGVKSFYDFNDNDLVTVLGPDGNWYPAIVKYYGKQPINYYTFKKNKTEIRIGATPNHRWINQHGEFQEGLNVKDKLFESPWIWEEFDFNNLTFEGKKYWCYGFVMGDGSLETKYIKSLNKYDKTGKSRVKLCKNKAKYLQRFQSVGWGLNCKISEPEITGITFNKTIPNFDDLPLEYLIAFIHGLYDADGVKALASNTGKPIYSIQFSNKELCNFVEKYFPVAGLYINSIRDLTGQKTNFGIRKYTKTYQFFGEKSSKFTWYVSSIEPINNLVDVWCLEVDNIHAFVLENGIPTGNCMSIPFDKLLANGFNTRQTDVRPANSVSTAFQLVAVIFQLQSLQQFGGTSATHLDWTMVPYVRKSFFKHFKNALDYLYNSNSEWLIAAIENDKIENISIDDKLYDYNKDAQRYALQMTLKEINQSVEGLYHNLNYWGD